MKERERILKAVKERERDLREGRTNDPRKRNEAEIVGDENDSDDLPSERDQKKEERYKMKEKLEEEQKSHKDRSKGKDAHIELQDIVKGPRETIKLEMPSPPKMQQSNDNNEPLPYFNGFLPKPNKKKIEGPKYEVTHKRVKEEPPSNKEIDNDNEDLLARWEKKLTKKKPTHKPVREDEWGIEINSDEEKQQQKVQIVPPKPIKQGYVENVLANQPNANGDEFEDNWDDDDDEDSPIYNNVDSTQYQKYGKENNTKFRHPDIPDEHGRKGKKKRRKHKS